MPQNYSDNGKIEDSQKPEDEEKASGGKAKFQAKGKSKGQEYP
jgi:hypothetical protein